MQINHATGRQSRQSVKSQEQEKISTNETYLWDKSKETQKCLHCWILSPSSLPPRLPPSPPSSLPALPLRKHENDWKMKKFPNWRHMKKNIFQHRKNAISSFPRWISMAFQQKRERRKEMKKRDKKLFRRRSYRVEYRVEYRVDGVKMSRRFQIKKRSQKSRENRGENEPVFNGG